MWSLHFLTRTVRGVEKHDYTDLVMNVKESIFVREMEVVTTSIEKI
jgi:hypothetical protein